MISQLNAKESLVYGTIWRNRYNMDILDIFYNKVMLEAQEGRINCYFFYNIAFATYIEEDDKFFECNIKGDDLLIPTLVIKDKATFDSLLIEYVNLAKDFYSINNYAEEILTLEDGENEEKISIEKVIISLLFANATVEDFNDPINFLRKRINFINNCQEEKYDLGYSESLKANLEVSLEKDKINNETPWQFVIKAKSMDNDEYVFPKIKFGVSNNQVFVYAIQNGKNIDSPFCKKINRALYKVGEGFYNNNYEEENLKDITASFLVALNIMISYFKNIGITKIVVPSILICRWNAKNISNGLKIKRYQYDEESIQDINEKQILLQYNLTNKLIRTFLRLGCHYQDFDILAYPFEIDSSLHMNFKANEIICNNTLLRETYFLMMNVLDKKDYHR